MDGGEGGGGVGQEGKGGVRVRVGRGCHNDRDGVFVMLVVGAVDPLTVD